MNSKDLTKDLKAPGAKWVKGWVDELSRDWGFCDQGIEASLKVVSDCLTIPEIPRWLADVIEESISLEQAIVKLGGIDTVSKSSKFNCDLLAKAWVLGYTVKEPLGVLLVDLPIDASYSYLRHNSKGYLIENTDTIRTIELRALKVTEAEAKEKYPNFKWVSLEELEND